MTLMDHTPAQTSLKPLSTRQERLRDVYVDYNHLEHAPDLTGLRHKPFIPGAGTTHNPEVVFLLKSPSTLDSRAQSVRDGIHYRLIADLCKGAEIDHYYVTYLMKYEMAGDRDPRELERNVALAYVREELSLLRPKLIALPGERIHRVMFPDRPYTPWSHRPIIGRRGSYYALPDLLPVRRTPSAYADMQEEFHLLREALDGNRR